MANTNDEGARLKNNLISFLHRLNFNIILGGILISLIILITIFAPYIATHDPNRTNVINRLESPSSENYFGTDGHGRDLFSRIVWGARVSVSIGLGVFFLTGIGGLILGCIAGYFTKLDEILMRVMDAMMSFPAIMLALSLVVILDPSAYTVVIALSIVYIPRTARIVRGSVLSLKENAYISAAKSFGGSDLWIIVRHVIPNLLSVLIVQQTFLIAMVFIAEASLSYIGAGPPPPNPTWGNIIFDGRQYIHQAPWLIIIPGLFIMTTVLGLNLLGDGLRDILDPHTLD